MTDAMKDFAQSTVTVGPSPPTSGTTATIANPSIYPAPPFDLTFWAPNTVPTLTTAEITRCTNLTAGVATITRNAYGYGVQAITSGFQCGQLVTANLLVQLGGLTGAGDPRNVVTPDFVGQDYTDSVTGIGYKSYGPDDLDWAQSATSPEFVTSPDESSVTSPDGRATLEVFSAGLFGYSWNFFALQNTGLNGSSLNILVIDVAPNGVVPAIAIGDMCVESHTPGVWMATAADNAHWIQIGGILPTSAAGLVVGSLWNSSGVVHVA